MDLVLFGMLNRWRRCRLEALQQERRVDDEPEGGRDASVHQDVQLGLAEAVLPEPLQHVLLVVHVPPVDAGEPLAEVHDGRQLGDAPLPGVPRVSHLDERDVQVVGFAVDQLEPLQHGVAFRVIVLN